jgi:oligosaccharide amylase
MPRDIPVGNGRLLVCFDDTYCVRDLYYPHVGQENHVGGGFLRFGVWVDNTFSWVDSAWKRELTYAEDTLITEVSLYHEGLGLLLACRDAVDFHEDVYIREIRVENMTPHEREIRLFFHQDFQISGNKVGDTALFDPKTGSLVHYKGSRYFLVGGTTLESQGLSQFAAGQTGMGGREGTFKDAEDGLLSGNPVAQGSVDSVAGLTLSIEGLGTGTAFYWIAAGQSWDEVRTIDAVVKDKGPEALLERTGSYWLLWARKETPAVDRLPAKVGTLYRRSLLILRTQIDREGGIIAANDSDVIQFNRDTYSYIWPRDGALVANALDLAGYSMLAQNFYGFMAKRLEREGYFLHKYNPDGTPASSWHPLFSEGKRQLPIQEDETGLVIWALWNHFVLYRDIEFIRPLYQPLVKRAADFMSAYRDSRTGLPDASYDLWEERRGILSFTVGAVFGGLTAASLFCSIFGEEDRAEAYRKAAADIRDAASVHLWREDLNRFCRMVYWNDTNELAVDATRDASLWGLFAFGLYGADDPRIRATFADLRERLWIKSDVGGMARYENDTYHRASEEVPGNPWFICTLWLADYMVRSAQDEKALGEAIEIMDWVCDHTLPSGVLAEQVHPFTGGPLSVSPLTWSHATFVTLTQRILGRLAKMETCTTCGASLIAPETRGDWIDTLYGQTCDSIHGMCEVH